MSVTQGELISIVGQSGSGKSTLLLTLAGILPPDRGTVCFDGRELSECDADGRAAIRLARFGFVFQFAELVPELSLVENVALPSWLLGASRRQADARARELLGEMGIDTATSQRTAREVSGGQAQRASIARAIAHGPAIVFADEPTGSLDAETSETVLSLLRNTVSDLGATLILITHDHRTAAVATRKLRMSSGRLHSIEHG